MYLPEYHLLLHTSIHDLYLQVACGGCHMLVLARPKVQNGEVSSESEQEAEEEVKPTKQLELLRRSDDLDLSGSFNARNRRREKQVGRINNVMGVERVLCTKNLNELSMIFI